VSYAYNPPYSVTRRRNGPPMFDPPAVPIRRIDELGTGAFVDAAGVSMTTGSAAWDRIIKWGFWLGMGALSYHMYRVARYGEPFFGGDGGVPSAWEANPAAIGEDEAELEKVCSWCKRWWVRGKWVKGSPPEDVRITHGICEDCFQRLEAEQPKRNPEQWRRP